MARVRRSSSGRRATPVDAVLDASALVRGLVQVDLDDAAVEWIEATARGDVQGMAPDIVYLEVANAFSVQVRSARMDLAGARLALRVLLELPLRTISGRSVAHEALLTATELRVSVYDACYLALAETANAVLVTADRRLADVARRSALVPGQRPPA